MLVQQSNRVITQPDLSAVRFLVSKDQKQAPANSFLRTNWRPNQQIAISKASGDSGMFELNFNDDRYLPFEGTGAICDWQLTIPQATNAFDLSTISDVIFYINYTAQDGGTEFAQQVMNLPEIKNYKGVLVVSIRQQFNQAWNTFMTSGVGAFSVSKLQFPANLQPPVMDETKITKIYRTKKGQSSGIDVSLKFDTPKTGDWQIKFTDPILRAELLDMILEIPYSADFK
jgi:Tc toxin complex TcA C-terminal TcB-binding domain